MNFFEHQEQARKNTALLILLFVLAAICIIAGTYLVLLFAMDAWVPHAPSSSRGVLRGARAVREASSFTWFRPDALLLALGLSGGTIAIGSLYKTFTLRAGGSTVAESLGGRLLQSGSTDPEEKRLMNVVEEMALASGIPVPVVYVLEDEEGINAFAAGNSIDDAAIGVTRGALRAFSRDELQGVIAHEFSHILHGDMRLNLRLIGVLHGILLMALVGRGVLHIRDRKNIAIPLVGLALIALGYAGVFFGNLIKAAVSRQREFLADAAAVQFTRNPGGIGGALRRIAEGAKHGFLDAPKASEASHLFFSVGIQEFLSFSVFATHPPLEERIARISGDLVPAQGASERGQVESAGHPVSHSTVGASGLAAGFAGTVTSQGSAPVSSRIGTTSPQAVARAGQTLQALPPPLVDAAHSLGGATALVCAALMSEQPDVVAIQGDVIRRAWGEAFASEAARLNTHVQRLGRRERLALIDLAAPALRQLTTEQRAVCLTLVRELSNADQHVSLFEFAVEAIVRRRLGQAPQVHARHVANVADVATEIASLVGAMALATQRTPQAVGHAYVTGMRRVFPHVAPTAMPDPAQSSVSAVRMNLERLVQSPPYVQMQLVDALEIAALADGVIEESEAELLRAIVETLGCPMPRG